MSHAAAQDFFFNSTDGLRLHALIHGAALGGLPVVCLPGLTRNARDFAGLAQYLAEEARRRRRVIAFSYRGRGLSDYDPDWRNYHPAVEMRDVLDGLAALGIDRAAFVGTSRGGLILHGLAASRPSLVVAAVLNDIGPELGRDGLLQIKAYLKRPRGEPLRSFTEAAAAQRATHGAAFPALADADWDRHAQALYRERGGEVALDFDPALTKILEAFVPDGPLPHLWPQFAALAAVPLLAIRGEHSALLTPETLEEMGRRHAGMEAVTAPGQGHAPLLETAGLPQRVADFLDRHLAG